MKTLSTLLLSIAITACGTSDNGNTDVPVDASPGSGSGSGSGSSTPDAPGVATGTDPADDGDFPVTSTNATIPGSMQGRSLVSTVFTPTGAPSPRPLVVVSPGFQMDRAQYTSYARHLATWGFVVVLTDYNGGELFPNHENLANDVPKVVDWALAQTSLAVDPQKIALAGHSLGGKISVFAAAKDSRVKAVVAWDPVDSNNPSVAPERMTNMSAAIAVIGETTNGTTDSLFGQACAPTADNFQTFYAAAPSPALSITVNGADHMDWVDDPSCGFCGFCDDGTAPEELARTVSRRVDVAWLRRHLMNDMSMETWLESPPELSAGKISISRR